MIIDAHQHFWDLEKCTYSWLVPEYGVIYDSFTAKDLAPLLKESGVHKTVAVQAADTYEDTEYMLASAAENEWIAGVVAWCPLMVPELTAQSIKNFSKQPIVRGIRHLIHEEVDPNWVVQGRVIESLKLLANAGLTFDLVSVYPLHLEHIHTLATKIPNLKIVIDHLAKPPILSGDISDWARDISALGKYPNVYVKLSGISTAADMENWTTKDLRPSFQTVLQAFGAKRIMFGSDWPVSLLAGGYKKNFDATFELIASLPEEDQSFIMGRTAADFYNIDLIYNLDPK